MIKQQDNNNNNNNNNINNKIPIIDFNNYKNNKIKICNDIRKACMEYGFFYIINHCVEEKVIQDLQDISKKFFSLPKQVKMQWKMGTIDKGHCGYFEIGGSQTYGIDYKEGIYLDLEREDDYKNSSGSGSGNSKRLFPTKKEEEEYGIQGYKDIVETYFNRLSELSDIVLECISESLNLPSTFFNGPNKKKTIDLTLMLAMLRYPSFATLEYRDKVDTQENKDEKLGMGSHTDWGLITLLYQDQIGGLQVKAGDQFIDATPIKGSFICNLGDFIEIATQGYYISNYHRVLYNTTPNDRYSYPFFVSPEYDEPIQIVNGLNDNSTTQQQKEFKDRYSFRGTYREYYENQINNTFKKYHK